MPFSAAQIGLGFRNEIHPKQGLLRVREFTMAEIEHFVDPENKDHPRFYKVKDLQMPLFSKENQVTNERAMIRDMTLQQAVETKVIDNETLAYFMAKTYLFLISVGIHAEAIRFRQHRDDEMAHYAKDCWDAEVETSYGWIEIAGHADRSCFDLSRHAKRTKTELVAARMLKEPKIVKMYKVVINKIDIGKDHKKDAKTIMDYLEELQDEDKEKYMNEMAANNEIVIPIGTGAEARQIKLSKELVQIESFDKTL